MSSRSSFLCMKSSPRRLTRSPALDQDPYKSAGSDWGYIGLCSCTLPVVVWCNRNGCKSMAHKVILILVFIAPSCILMSAANVVLHSCRVLSCAHTAVSSLWRRRLGLIQTLFPITYSVTLPLQLLIAAVTAWVALGPIFFPFSFHHQTSLSYTLCQLQLLHHPVSRLSVHKLHYLDFLLF